MANIFALSRDGCGRSFGMRILCRLTFSLRRKSSLVIQLWTRDSPQSRWRSLSQRRTCCGSRLRFSRVSRSSEMSFRALTSVL